MIYHIRSALAAMTGGDGAARQSLPGTRMKTRTRRIFDHYAVGRGIDPPIDPPNFYVDEAAAGL